MIELPLRQRLPVPRGQRLPQRGIWMQLQHPRFVLPDHTQQLKKSCQISIRKLRLYRIPIGCSPGRRRGLRRERIKQKKPADHSAGLDYQTIELQNYLTFSGASNTWSTRP